MYFELDFDLCDMIIALGLLYGFYLTFRSPKKHCACGVKIPEGGGMCKCGEYNGRMVIKEQSSGKIIDKRREEELKRIEEEKRKGNDYDTFL